MDHWYAECLPCRWQEGHDTQDSAISAAEGHVFDHHSELFRMSADARSRKMAEERIGHVQLRAENALSTAVPAFPLNPVVTEPAAAAPGPVIVPDAPAEE